MLRGELQTAVIERELNNLTAEEAQQLADLMDGVEDTDSKRELKLNLNDSVKFDEEPEVVGTGGGLRQGARLHKITSRVETPHFSLSDLSEIPFEPGDSTPVDGTFADSRFKTPSESMSGASPHETAQDDVEDLQ